MQYSWGFANTEGRKKIKIMRKLFQVNWFIIDSGAFVQSDASSPLSCNEEPGIVFQYDHTQGKSQFEEKLSGYPGLLLLEHNILDEKGVYPHNGLGILSLKYQNQKDCTISNAWAELRLFRRNDSCPISSS